LNRWRHRGKPLLDQSFNLLTGATPFRTKLQNNPTRVINKKLLESDY
jgi:hypothetical protein